MPTLDAIHALDVDANENCVGVNIEGMDGIEGWDDFAHWLAAQPATPPERAIAITDEHDVYQMYTSGTTGQPKGAVLDARRASPRSSRR